MATKPEIELFLRQLKEKIRFFDVAFRPREKNTIALTELDILARDRLDYILCLTPEQYYTGPNKDTYDTGKPDYYEFGIQVKRREVYVKISLGLPNKQVDCMSFHVAEFPIRYPFKEEQP